jgi:hypothetical protein
VRSNDSTTRAAREIAMHGQAHHLERFIRRVHRRFIIVRALERAGACAAIASLFAAILASILFLQGRDSLPLVIALLGAGATVGLLWGFIRRPTQFEAATEADRQLALSDLLATALSARNSDSAWGGAVIAIAEERCRTLSPTTVIVHRFGGRAWGGIGLSAAMVLTIGLLSSVPGETPVRAGMTLDSGSRAVGELPKTLIPENPSTDATARTRDADSRSVADENRDTVDPSVEATAARPGKTRSSHSGETGGGTGAAQMPSVSGSVPRLSAGDQNDADNREGEFATGGAATHSADRADPSGAVSGGVGASPALEAPTPSQDRSGPSDRTAAMQAVRSGRVPDAYRDVVSEYFRGGEPARP